MQSLEGTATDLGLSEQLGNFRNWSIDDIIQLFNSVPLLCPAAGKIEKLQLSGEDLFSMLESDIGSRLGVTLPGIELFVSWRRSLISLEEEKNKRMLGMTLNGLLKPPLVTPEVEVSNENQLRRKRKRASDIPLPHQMRIVASPDGGFFCEPKLTDEAEVGKGEENVAICLPAPKTNSWIVVVSGSKDLQVKISHLISKKKGIFPGKFLPDFRPKELNLVLVVPETQERPTLKILRCLANGLPIVTTKWTDAIEDLNDLKTNEEKDVHLKQITDEFEHHNFPSRVTRQENKVFEGLIFFLAGTYEVGLDKATTSELIRQAGGSLSKSPETSNFVILGSGTKTRPETIPCAWFENQRPNSKRPDSVNNSRPSITGTMFVSECLKTWEIVDSSIYRPLFARSRRSMSHRPSRVTTNSEAPRFSEC